MNNATNVNAAAIESLRELTEWMRSNLGPADGTHEMLCRAVERLEKVDAERKDANE